MNSIQISKYPARDTWKQLLSRPGIDHTSLHQQVSDILSDVAALGDKAVFNYTERFDGVRLHKLQVSEEEITQAVAQVSEELKESIQVAINNITAFHEAQRFKEIVVETMPGVTCYQRAVAIDKVGLYVPGGTAPLFSTVLMLAIPAKLAGCAEIVLCSPPNKEGVIHPAVLYAAQQAGVKKIFKAGGVQAVAAMAYGTESVPKVYKIFGPGNQYLTAAKQLVSLRDVAIDMPAGPSEVLVIADDTAHPAFVAADLLSQAEHGADSQVILLTTSEQLLEQVLQELHHQLEALPRKDLAMKSLQHSRMILLETMEEIIDMSNAYAPEHLLIEVDKYPTIVDKITNAGSVFLGHYTPESAGDYASGTNHTLPTNGYAQAYSGVNLDSFTKKITYQEITREGLGLLGPHVERMAANERLEAHKNAVSIRLKQ